MLPGVGEREALAVAERLRREVTSEFREFPVPISVSVGIADSAPCDGAEALVRAANRALFAAKRLGRDRCVIHHAETLAMLDALADDRAGEQLEAAMLLAETLDLRDVATARHSETVGRYAERIADELGLAPDQVERLRVAGVLHDIGKLGISDAVLLKPGGLELSEWEEIRRHPEMGARILEHANLRDVASWVLAHHERIDGAGYPRGLTGDTIPLEGRILAVADAYEAMTADRPYRRALAEAEARAELVRGAGTPVRRRRRRGVPARARLLVDAGQLAVVPARDRPHHELQTHPLPRLRTQVLRVDRRAGVALEDLDAELEHVLAVDDRLGLQHHAPQLVVGVAGLDLQRAARVALEVADLLRLRVRPRPQLAVADHVPERHQMRPAVAAERGAGDHALVVEEGRDLLGRHRDLRPTAHAARAMRFSAASSTA